MNLYKIIYHEKKIINISKLISIDEIIIHTDRSGKKSTTAAIQSIIEQLGIYYFKIGTIDVILFDKSFEIDNFYKGMEFVSTHKEKLNEINNAVINYNRNIILNELI